MENKKIAYLVESGIAMSKVEAIIDLMLRLNVETMDLIVKKKKITLKITIDGE